MHFEALLKGNSAIYSIFKKSWFECSFESIIDIALNVRCNVKFSVVLYTAKTEFPLYCTTPKLIFRCIVLR